MNISNFDDLLQAAAHQPLQQRLLMVFASADLPSDCTAAQRAEFEAGSGGALVPAMCVDKAPDEIESFATLKQEAAQFQKNWQIVFVAALSGVGQAAPHSTDVEQALENMVASIKVGKLMNMIAFDQHGEAVSLS